MVIGQRNWTQSGQNSRKFHISPLQREAVFILYFAGLEIIQNGGQVDKCPRNYFATGQIRIYRTVIKLVLPSHFISALNTGHVRRFVRWRVRNAIDQFDRIDRPDKCSGGKTLLARRGLFATLHDTRFMIARLRERLFFPSFDSALPVTHIS